MHYGRMRPETLKTRVACKRIESQFPLHIPEAQLMFAIVESAIRDLHSGYVYYTDVDGRREYHFMPYLDHRLSARTYLEGDILHAEICGVSADWIRQTLIDCELWEGAKRRTKTSFAKALESIDD